MNLISEKTIERLILYRGLLLQANHENESGIYSHQLARMAGFTPAQVRRDLMQVGYTGSPARGYDKAKLIQSISALVDPAEKREIALAGIGSIGRAILAYFHGRSSLLEITAAFDTDPEKTGRVIHGCRCHPVDRLADIVRERGIRTGILCVPAGAAQSVTDALVEGGIRGILNYAPTRLIVPPDVYVENRDMIMAVEKVVYFSGLKTGQRKENG
ncbi:MAG: redox-sensing transcriptional repressor Rex [bacterium]|nr:redox-sensing transcriptional repressor Rex [bacterium]